MASNHCAGTAVDLGRYGHLGETRWRLRGRIGAPGPGQVTAFAGPHVLTFNRPYWEQLDRWARNMDHWGRSFPSTAGPKTIAWFGEVGSLACHRPTAAHNRARGLDLCHIRYTDGDFIDMNASHAADLRHRRRYLAVAANLRRFFGTVLTRDYNAAHRDHIHVDDLRAVRPLRTEARTDTTLVQSAANLLAGAGLVVDGAWGRRTETAYRELVRAFALECTDPRASTHHAQIFLSFVVSTAMADVPAGTHRSNVCDPCAAPGNPVIGVECAVDDLIG